MKLQDKSTHTQFTTDDRGYLTTTAKLARIGSMQYLGEEIGKTPNKVYDVHVEAEDLFSPETIKSFENTPVTIEHPEEMIYRQEHLQPLGDKQTQDQFKKEECGA